MSLVPISNLKLDGQQVFFNSLSKVVIVEIQKPFMQAGNILNWDPRFGSPGFGINKSILDFVTKTKSKLLIKCQESDQKEYWINYDSLKNFIDNNNCGYTVSGKFLFIIPWLCFKSKPYFSGTVEY